MVSLSFVIASIIILITPGPTNTVLASCGATMGFRRAALMPLAEAAGYVLAISFFVFFAGHARDNPQLMSAVKMIAATWLLFSAYRLWTAPMDPGGKAASATYVRVFLTTAVNPKAMLVGTILIPAHAAPHTGLWIGTYAALSTMAGTGWVYLGSLLPMGLRKHSYKLAAVVLSGFSVAAAASAFG